MGQGVRGASTFGFFLNLGLLGTGNSACMVENKILNTHKNELKAGTPRTTYALGLSVLQLCLGNVAACISFAFHVYTISHVSFLIKHLSSILSSS